MSTTTMKLKVNLLEKAVTFMANILLQMGYRISHWRVPGSRYMSRTHQILEDGFRTWLTEGTLLDVNFEIYDPLTDKAYEVGVVELEYLADPNEDEENVVKKPPIDQLEGLFTRLQTLPEGAKFRVVVNTAPGASEVEGWYPTVLKEFMGGVKEDIEVGDGHGFGHIKGKTRYLISNWGEQGEDPAGRIAR
jgi:hypothetical protein